jgi:hypothetical protein
MKLLVDVVVPKSNLIESNQLPALKYPIIKGVLSLSFGFEQTLSGSITYEAIHPDEIDLIRSTYNKINTRLDIYNHACIIKSYSDVVQRVYSDELISIETYSASISLSSWWEYVGSQPVQINSTRSLSSSLTLKVGITALSKLCGVPYIGPYFEFTIPPNSDKNYATSLVAEISKYARLNKGYISYTNLGGIELRLLESHKVWYFDESDLIYTLQTSNNEVPSFINADLGTFDTKPELQDLPLINTSTAYSIESPVEFVSTEGQDSSVPPRGGYITDSTSVADASGPRKSSRKVRTLNGNPIEEEITTYGYVYTASQVSVDEPGKPIRGGAEGFWQVIESYLTQYIYRSASPNLLNTTVIDNLTGELITAYYLPNQAFQGFLSGANFLVGTATSGYKTHRFSGETSVKDMRDYVANLAEAVATNDTVSENYYEALIAATTWKTLGYSAGSNLTLDYYSNYYNLVEDVPYTIEKVLPNSIFGEGIASVETDSQGFAYLLSPDPNYTPKLFVLNESSYSNTFASIANPENILLEDEYNQASAEDKEYIVYRPPLSTGEESSSETKRNITAIQPRGAQGTQLADQSFYTEYTQTSSSGEANFGVATINTSIKTIAGKPPSAQSYRNTYTPLDNLNQYRDSTRVLITSDKLNSYSSVGESFNFPTLYIHNALEAAETELTIRHLLNVTRTVVKLAWFYPDIREGDIIDIYGTDISNTTAKKALNISYSINFSGTIEDGSIRGVTLATCDGVDLGLGSYVKRKITSKQEKVDNRGIYSSISGTGSAPISGGTQFSVSAGARRS